MKYIVVSLILLVLMLGLCLVASRCVVRAIEETGTLLDAAWNAAAANESEVCLQKIQAASDTWESYETFFGTVLRHDEIDNIMGEFAKLEAYALTQDRSEFLSNCASLLSQLEHIREMEEFSIQNIM